MVTTRLILAVLFLSALASTGCATMINGRHQDVLVLSEPSGAAIRLNGVPVGSTPTTVRMPRRAPVVLLIEKAGHVAASVPVGRSESGWMFGNFVFLNPMAAQGMDSMGQWMATAAAWFTGSMAIDVLSGGGFKRPPVVTVTLPPLPGAPAPAPSPAAAGATASGAPRTPPGYSPRVVPPGRPWTR